MNKPKRSKKSAPLEPVATPSPTAPPAHRQDQTLKGCSPPLIKALLTISLVSLVTALVLGLPRLEAQCRIEDYQETRGLFQPVLQKISLRLYTGNDRTWPAVAWQAAAKWAEPAVTFVDPNAEPALAEPRSRCWYNPLWSSQATLEPWGLIFPLPFWLLLTLALPTGALGLAGRVWQPRQPTSAGQHLTVRLYPEGNPNPWREVQFNLLLALTLGGPLWPLWQAAQWLPSDFGSAINLNSTTCLGILSFLLVFGALFMLYQAARQLRLGLVSRGITVELSAHPLQPGQTAQLYLSLPATSSTSQVVQVKLVCRQTVEEQYTDRKGEDKGETRYRHRTSVIYEANLDKEANLNHPTPSERILSLTIPPEAQVTVKTPLYDPIGWAVVVRRPRANAPDVELDFPLEVVK
ncbi:MAG: hypothetical protein HS114_17610 [Anaerolineales bacterium]|nr:hypothetical protein [Anaerolineales bacterium]